MAAIITSQSYLDQAIVDAKSLAGDYDVMVSPEFTVDGEPYRVILDGHHSYEAARNDGVEPSLTEATAQQHDAVSLLSRGRVEDFLAAVKMESSWHFADAPKRMVW